MGRRVLRRRWWQGQPLRWLYIGPGPVPGPTRLVISWGWVNVPRGWPNHDEDADDLYPFPDDRWCIWVAGVGMRTRNLWRGRVRPFEP